MRLTNYMRDAFIRAAMDDVPKTDYSEIKRKLILDDAIAQLPPKVRAIYQDASLRHFVNTSYAYHFGGSSIPCGSERYTPTDETREQYKKLEAAHEDQTKRLRELEDKLKACAYSVTTREQLVKLLPEFEKYMPAREEKAIRSLPVVANVVADFVKAGWPKDAKKPTKKAA